MSIFYGAKIHRAADRNEYLVVVYRRFPRKALTVGCFYFRGEAESWAKDTIKRRAWRDASELPDDYEKGVSA